MTQIKLPALPFSRLARIAMMAGLSVVSGCTAEAAGHTMLDLDSPELEMSGTPDSGQWQSAPWVNSRWIALGARATRAGRDGPAPR